MNNKKIKVTLKEFSKVKDMLPFLSLINQFYPELDQKKYQQYLTEMVKQNYKMLVVFHDEKAIAVCGYYVSYMFYCGKYLQFCNLIVDKNYRNRGIGTKIIKYLEEKAKNLDCDKIVLDSYIQNKRSHSLYYENGFYIRGFHFMKNIND